jgi:hypothetical protein
LELLNNLFFAYNLSNEELKRCEDYMEPGDYMILFSINVSNNSLVFKMYGKIDMQKIAKLKEKIINILNGERYDLHTCGLKKLYENQKIICCEMNFYGERCTPLFKEKLLNKVKYAKVADKVIGETVEPLDLIKAIEDNTSIITITRYVVIPETGEINVFINIFAETNKIDAIKSDLDAEMFAYTFSTEYYKTSYVPFTGQTFCRYEIVYTNQINCV